MMLHKPMSLSATISGILGLSMLAAAGAAHAQQVPPEGSAKPLLGEVVVTAQKRVQALADVPMSVSVIGGDALENAQADNFQDLVSMVPGLSLNTNTRGVTRLTLRGINTGGVATTVGVYVNDVPFGSSSGLANGAILSGDFDTLDMNRIEVLRGPQGTLYGASSLGGVLKYVANEPSTEGFEARVKGTMEDVKGADLGYALTGTVNIPVGDRFALRFAGFYRSDEGYIDSIGNNPIPSIQNPAVNIVDGSRVENDLNGAETSGGRLSALFEPSDAFSLNLMAYFQDIESDNHDLVEADPDTLEPLYGGLIASRYHPEPTDIEYRIYSATADWDLGGVSLQSVTSYSEFSQTFQLDAAVLNVLGLPTAQLVTLFFSDPTTAQPPYSAILNQVTSTDKFTQELRLVSPDSDAFEWLLGAYYTDEDSALDPQNLTAVDAGTETPAAGVPPLAEIFLRSTYQELAFFANATWHVSDRFDLSFGGRQSNNDQKASQQLDVFVFPAPIVFDDVKSSESPFTWSVSPRMDVSDSTSVYARVATGFRPGGPNVLPPGAPPGTPGSYDSDRLTNYEFGVKTGTADGSFSLDAALYYLDWEDVQLLAVVGGVGINANGGTAVSRGFEFAANVRTENGFSLGMSGAYTDAYLTKDTDPAIGGLDGDPLPFVPKWTLGLNADYKWAVMGNATAHVGGQIAYTGDRSADFGNRDTNGDIREANSYTTVGLRAGLESDRWSVELYGKNLTDKRGINDIQAPGAYPNGAVALGVIRPRTVGLSVGVKF